MIREKKGFVILFAVTVSAVIMLLAVGIFAISHRQTILASQAEESMRALMVADSIMECALYYDFNSTSDFDTTFFAFSGNGWQTNRQNNNLTCFARPVTASTDRPIFGNINSPNISDGLTGNFWFRASAPNDRGCGIVLVQKTPASNSLIQTIVTAVGYNVCDANGLPNTNSPILLERRINKMYTR